MKNWKEYKNFWNTADKSWQKKTENDMYINVNYYDHEEITLPYELDFQIPEEKSITGTTIDVKCFLDFKREKVNFDECEKKAIKIINKLVV